MEYSCGVEVALAEIGGKWSAVILAQLKERPQRYGELRREIGGISEKVLTDRLRRLAATGLVRRLELGGNPPGTSYELTADGESLRPALTELHEWGVEWARRRGLAVRSETA